VWEFLTNQTVADMVSKFDDPLTACRAVVAEAYRLWLQYEVRTDDITMILAYIDHSEEAAAKLKKKSIEERIKAASRNTQNKPMRRILSEEKKHEMAVVSTMDEDDNTDWVMKKIPKSDAELERIKGAVKANFLFSHLNEHQTEQVYDVMEKRQVVAGEVVIKQGEAGDWFYVVDEGEYVVTLKTPSGTQAEILTYTTEGGANPCFGELALMYGKPRAATVTAKTGGVLWAMDRKSFRAILIKSSMSSLKRTLRSVEILKSLTASQMTRLQDLLTEVSFKPNEYVITQGDDSSNMYIIAEGKVRITKSQDDGEEAFLMELGQGSYFGERALLRNERRAANVIASSEVKLLYISKQAFEEVLGSLQDIIDADRKQREEIAHKKAMLQAQEGLADVTIDKLVSAIESVSCESDPFQYTLCKIEGKEYTMKVALKAKVDHEGLHERMEIEKELRSLRMQSHRMVPLALTTLTDDTHLYIVFHNSVCTLLSTLMGEDGFEEPTARFYSASVCLALEQLYTDGIMYRNLMADAIAIDEQGYVQLMDMRYAVRADSSPADFCGYAHYLAPEQVDGQGHGIAVDYWALGILTYEMCFGGANPWLTGDSVKDTELGIYQRITAHTAGSLAFPDGGTEELEEYLNDLVHPVANERLGARAGGLKEVRLAPWFANFQWEALETGQLRSPCADEALDALDSALKARTTPEGIERKLVPVPTSTAPVQASQSIGRMI